MMPNQYNWGKNKTSIDIEQIGGTCFVIVSNIEAPENNVKKIDVGISARTINAHVYSLEEMLPCSCEYR